MKNSWEIIKSVLVKNSRPQTMGRNIEINQCSDLFVELMNHLIDKNAAVQVFNDDSEVKDAIIARKGIEELRKAGILS